MPEQFYGQFSRFVPTLEIGGVEYGAMVRFNTNPQKPEGSQHVCPGTLQIDPEDLGTGLVRVVARRALQYDSYTIVEGFGNSWEQIVPILMGGNICQTTEPQRLYSWANDRAFRGGDAADRAQPGDVLWWSGRGFLIVTCTAFGHAPSGGVTWQGDTHLPTTNYRDVSPNAVRLTAPDTTDVNALARIHFPVGDTGVFADCGLYVETAPDVLVPMARRIFDGPVSEVPDPSWYPPDASFSDSAVEYWVDPASYAFRIGSFTATLGTTLGALCYHRGLRESANGVTYFVIEGTGNGYGISGGTEDSICLVSTLTTGNFSQAFLVHVGGDNAYGMGSVEWRAGSEPDDPFVALLWDGGTVVGVTMRPAKGEPVESVAFTANVDAFAGTTFWVRVAKSGGDIAVAWSADGSAWTTAATVTLAGVVELTTGNVGAATWDDAKVKIMGWIPATTLRLLTFSPGVLSRTTIQFWEDVAFSESVPLATETAITSVHIERRKADGSVELLEMTEDGSEPRGRDRYTLDGDELVFYSETAGDRVRVVQEAEEGTPESPGRPPRMGNTVGMADGACVANRCDVLVIVDLAGEMTATAGEDFEVRRDPVFDPLNPPALTFDVKADEGTDYAALPEGVRLFLPVEGLVLLRQSWLAEFDPADDLCFRADGDGYSQAGNMHARQVNDLAAAVDCFDQLWIPVGIGGAPAGVSGVGRTEAPLPSGFTCVGCTEVDRTGLIMAAGDRANWFGEVEALIAAGASFPYWRDYGGGTIGKRFAVGDDVMQYTSAAFDVPHVCCPLAPFTASWNESGIATPAHRLDVFPFVGELPHFGNDAIADGGHGQLFPLSPSFSFDGTPITPGGVLSRLPAGTVCLEAKLEVTFTGVESKAYSGRQWRIEAGGSSNTYLNEYYLNGLLRAREHVVAGSLVELIDNTEVPEFETSGSLAFVLIGRRANSKNVWLPLSDRWATVPDADWKSFGGGVAVGGSFEDGKSTVIDVTSCINAALTAPKEYRDLYLWPTRAGVDPSTSEEGMAAFLELLKAKQEVTDDISIVDGVRVHEVNWTFEGQVTRWESMTVAGCLARFRLPSGLVVKIPIPFNWPRMIA